MRNFLITSIILSMLLASVQVFAQQKILFGFEKDAEGWQIPDWAFDQADHIGLSSEVTMDQASQGVQSLKVDCDFPGNSWAAAVVEYEQDIDLTGKESISVDIFVPETRAVGFLQARINITADLWYYIEMKKPVMLKAGEWTTVEARIDISKSRESAYWKCKAKEECVNENLDKIKKIAVRVEYDANSRHAGPPYNGPIYFDNIVIK